MQGQVADQPTCERTWLSGVINELVHLSRERLIECSVHGGVFELDSELPPGLTVRVRDYDIDGYASDRITEDEDGESCVESQYASRG